MNKISNFITALLLTSVLLINISEICVNAKSKPVNINHKEIVYMKILLAILDDPDFVTMSSQEQHHILDAFYNHVNTYLREGENEKQNQKDGYLEKE